MREEATTEAAAPPRGNAYAWYVTGLLMLAYTFSFLDRQILSLMVGPIRRDLQISDSEFALLAGTAFGIFYTIMGLPIGWMADRYNRRTIISAGIAVWSFMTMACGAAGSFGHLFLARIGVGVGEATLSPSAYSLLSDYFDKSRLPRAMSVYTVGIFIGAGMALIIGSQVVTAMEGRPAVTLPLLGEMRSWQLVFLIVGAPGLLLAAWVATLREPVRRGRAEHAPFGEVFRFIGRYKLMCLAFFLGGGLYSVIAYVDTWYSELFIRTWGWDVSLAGRVNGASSLIAGPIGLLFAGWYSSRMIARGQIDGCLRLTAYGALGITIPAVLMPLMPDPWLMALMLFPFKFCVGFPPVLIASAMQMVAPNRLRGQMGAVFLFSTGIIGISCGPILPALLTDYVFRDEHALRYSLAIASGVVGPLAFVILWLGLGQFRLALKAAEAWR